jgi:hypothetical protein
MSGPIKLNSPRYRVVFGDPEDPATWEEFEVQSITRDIASAETLFAQHKSWGKPLDSAIKLTAVSAFFALKRTGQVSGSYEGFEENFIEVSTAGDDAVDPTPPDLEAGS